MVKGKSEVEWYAKILTPRKKKVKENDKKITNM